MRGLKKQTSLHEVICFLISCISYNLKYIDTISAQPSIIFEILGFITFALNMGRIL